MDWSSLTVSISGDNGYSKSYTDADTTIISKTGDQSALAITINPDADFVAGEVITVIVNARDLFGNVMLSPTWSFTVIDLPSIILTGSDVSACCGPGTYIYADINDTTALDSVTSIEVMTISFDFDINYPGKGRITGPANVGYTTGSIVNVLQSNVFLNVNETTSLTFTNITTDEKGESLDPSDINAMQIAVWKLIGPPQVVVTNIRIEIYYKP